MLSKLKLYYVKCKSLILVYVLFDISIENYV